MHWLSTYRIPPPLDASTITLPLAFLIIFTLIKLMDIIITMLECTREKQDDPSSQSSVYCRVLVWGPRTIVVFPQDVSLLGR